MNNMWKVNASYFIIPEGDVWTIMFGPNVPRTSAREILELHNLIRENTASGLWQFINE